MEDAPPKEKVDDCAFSKESVEGDVPSKDVVKDGVHSEETLAARKRVQNLLGRQGICWENPIIGEQNEIRFAVELIDTLGK
jgi:hypothetical protein